MTPVYFDESPSYSVVALTMKKLEEEGIISYSSGVVKILDADGLQEVLSRS